MVLDRIVTKPPIERALWARRALGNLSTLNTALTEAVRLAQNRGPLAKQHRAQRTRYEKGLSRRGARRLTWTQNPLLSDEECRARGIEPVRFPPRETTQAQRDAADRLAEILRPHVFKEALYVTLAEIEREGGDSKTP